MSADVPPPADQPGAKTERLAAEVTETRPEHDFAEVLKRTAYVSTGVSILGIALFAGFRPAWGYHLGLSLMVLFAAAGVGAVLGFLFGVPKAGSAHVNGATLRVPYTANTNFEKISDWFTTLVVGVGLVEFRELITATKWLANRLGTAFGDPAGSNAGAVYGISLVFAGVFVSFLLVYLWVRTRFYRELRDQEETVVSTGVTVDGSPLPAAREDVP